MTLIDDVFFGFASLMTFAEYRVSTLRSDGIDPPSALRVPSAPIVRFAPTFIPPSVSAVAAGRSNTVSLSFSSTAVDSVETTLSLSSDPSAFMVYSFWPASPASRGNAL